MSTFKHCFQFLCVPQEGTTTLAGFPDGVRWNLSSMMFGEACADGPATRKKCRRGRNSNLRRLAGVRTRSRNPGAIGTMFGGADGIRTHDLLDAIEARSQLRHGPTGGMSQVYHSQRQSVSKAWLA